MLGACANDDDGEAGKTRGTDRSTDVKSVPATPYTSKSPKDLKKPIFARCATQGFVRRAARLRVSGTSAGVWQVNYQVPRVFGVAPKVDTTIVLLVEHAPDPTARPFDDSKSRIVNVEGRRVSLRENPQRATRFAARWTTGAATYTALANGKRSTTLRRFIACLP